MQIGPYTVVGEIARGGMGAVYRAHDPSGLPVAIKLLLAHRNRSERGLRRFETEIATHSRLLHPNVVRVHGSGVHEGVPYVVLDYVEGETLQDRLRRGPLPIVESVRFGRSIASALYHAHEQGVVHRDLKPENVLVDAQDRVHLSDFGLALDLEESRDRLTTTGQFMGTPGYWAPEQALGLKHLLGPATDVYGLGATLFGLLTGRPPVTGSAIAQLEEFDYIPRVQSLRPDTPSGVSDLVNRCLQPDAGARPHALQVLAEFDRLLEAGVSPKRAPSRNTKQRLLLPLLCVAMSLVSAIAGVLAWQLYTAPTEGGRETPEAAAPTALTGQLRAQLIRDLEAGRHAAVLDALGAEPGLPIEAVGEFRAAALIGLERWEEARAVLDAAIEASPTAPLYLLRARAQRQLGDERAARADFDLAVAHPSATHAVYHSVFHEYDDRGEWVRAEHVISRALKQQPTAKYALDLAVLLKDQSRYDEALVAARKATALDPSVVTALSLTGNLLLELDRRAEAQRVFEQLLREHPKQPHGYQGRARIHLRDGNSEQAVADYERAHRLKPLDADTSDTYGRLLLELKRFRDAAEFFAAQIRLDPKPEFYSGRATVLLILGEVDPARADLQRALDLDPTNARALAILFAYPHLSDLEDARVPKARRLSKNPAALFAEVGDLLRRRDLSERAERAYRLSLDIEYDNVDTLASMGLCVANQQDRLRAEGYFDAALRLDPRSARALYLRGANRRHDKRYRAALIDLDAALLLEPSNLGARLMRADALRLLDRQPEALAEYARVLEVRPDHADALFGNVDSLVRGKQIGEALKLLREATRRVPDDVELWRYRAELANKLRNLEESAEAYARVVRLNPEDVKAWQVLGLLYFDLSRYDESITACEQALARGPSDWDTRMNLAGSLRHGDRPQRAIAAYLELIAEVPDNHRLHFGLGDTYRGIGQLQQALSALRRATELKTNYGVAFYGLGLVYAQLDRWPEALTELQRAAELGMGELDGFFSLLCVARYRVADRETARSDLELRLIEEPNEASVLWAHAELAEAQGAPPKVVRGWISRARAAGSWEVLDQLIHALEAKLGPREE